MNERTFKASDAQKLEDPARLEWLPPADVIGKLDLTPGMVVADIGAGTGYFSIPIAARVNRVFSVDLQTEMLGLLRGKLASTGLAANIELVHGSAVATNLAAASCDLAFFANVWHELDDLDMVLAEARRILRAGGRLAIVDWSPDRDHPPGPPVHHRIAPEQVRSVLEAAGWTVAPASPTGRYHYMVIALA